MPHYCPELGEMAQKSGQISHFLLAKAMEQHNSADKVGNEYFCKETQHWCGYYFAPIRSCIKTD